MDIRASVVVALVCMCSVSSVGSSEVELLGPDNVSVEQHTAIKLMCRVPIATTQVIWKRGLTTIEADAAKKITIAFSEVDASSHDSVLTIAEAEQTDSGDYTCSCDDSGHNHQSEKTVHVEVTESQISLSAISKRVTLVPGSPLTLACHADIHTHVEWRKGSDAIRNDSEVTISEDTNSDNEHIKTSKLTIRHATGSHAGNYVCQNEHHADDKDEIVVSQSGRMTSATSGKSTESALLLGSVLVLAVLLR